MHYEASGVLSLATRSTKQGRKEKHEEIGTGDKKIMFRLDVLPHPESRPSGSVVDNQGPERVCGLGAAAWLPRREEGRGAHEPRAPVGRDGWCSWGQVLGGGGFLIGLKWLCR